MEVVPFCTQCKRDITQCTRFVKTPCCHFFCDDCLRHLPACPIDTTPFVYRHLHPWNALTESLNAYVKHPTSFSLRNLFETINVNDVLCKRNTDPSHKRDNCLYHHAAAHILQDSGNGWVCPKCKIKNDFSAPRCLFCMSMPRSPSANRSLESPKESFRAKSPMSQSRRSIDAPQVWVCEHCSFETSEESHLCLNCNRTNETVKRKLAAMGRDMQLCPKCMKLNTFSAAKCAECGGPMHDYYNLGSQKPTWRCEFCAYGNEEFESWVCAKCSRTSEDRKRSLKAEGKEMIKCLNRHCQNWCPWNATECHSCHSSFVQPCTICGSKLSNGVCRNCDSRRVAVCPKCKNPLIQGKCPDCISPREKLCPTCRSRLTGGRCQMCDSRQTCRVCGNPLIRGICEHCESLRTRKCPKCGIELNSAKCNICSSRSRSPVPASTRVSSSFERVPRSELTRPVSSPRRNYEPVYPAPRSDLYRNRVQNNEQRLGYHQEVENQHSLTLALAAVLLAIVLYLILSG